MQLRDAVVDLRVDVVRAARQHDAAARRFCAIRAATAALARMSALARCCSSHAALDGGADLCASDIRTRRVQRAGQPVRGGFLAGKAR